MTSYLFRELYLKTEKGKQQVMFLHKNFIIFAPIANEDETEMKMNVAYVNETKQQDLLMKGKHAEIIGDKNIQVLDDFLDKYELHQIH